MRIRNRQEKIMRKLFLISDGTKAIENVAFLKKLLQVKNA